MQQFRLRAHPVANSKRELFKHQRIGRCQRRRVGIGDKATRLVAGEELAGSRATNLELRLCVLDRENPERPRRRDIEAGRRIAEQRAGVCDELATRQRPRERHVRVPDEQHIGLSRE